MHFSIPPGSRPPLDEEAEGLLARLRAEAANTQDAAQKASLLHEVGRLEEAAHDDHQAANDLLAAVNASTSRAEPLEQLIALLDRRSSHKNLPRLFERLIRLARRPEQKARADAGWAEFLCDVQHDMEQGLSAWKSALEAAPDSPGLWLSSQLQSTRTTDLDHHAKALEARAQLTPHRALRDALELRLADVHRRRGDSSGARRTLLQLAGRPGPMCFHAWRQLERLAMRTAHGELLLQSLVAQARILREVQTPADADDPQLAPARGDVSAVLADYQLRIALVQLRDGQLEASRATLQLARTACPTNLPMLFVELCTQPPDLAQPIAYGTNLGPTLEGALRLREAQAATDDESRIGALRAALDLDPRNIAARAWLLNLLGRDRLLREFAELLHKTAENHAAAPGEQLNDTREDMAAKYEVLASLSHWLGAARYRAAGNGAASGHHGAHIMQSPALEWSMRALDRAERFGLPSRKRLRVARQLLTAEGALVHERARAYGEALEQLLPTCAPKERVSMLLERYRLSQLEVDAPRGRRILTDLKHATLDTGVTPTLNTALWLGAYGPAREKDSAASLTALEALASPTDDASATPHPLAAPGQAALRQWTVVRALAQRNDNGSCELPHPHRQWLTDSSHPLSQLLLNRVDGDDDEALQRLCRLADSPHQSSHQTAFGLLAALALWHAGNRRQAIERVRGLPQHHPTPLLLHWMLRTELPDDKQARREILSLESPEEDELPRALQRFALETKSHNPQAASAALEGAAALIESCALEGTDPPSTIWEFKPKMDGLRAAVQLAAALWPTTSKHQLAREALAKLPVGLEAAAASAYLGELRAPRPRTDKLLSLSAAWARSGSLAGQLEWYAQSVGISSPDEVEARRQIAQQVEGEARVAINAGATLVSVLHGTAASVPLNLDSAPAALAALEVSTPGSEPARRARCLGQAGRWLPPRAQAQALTMAGYNQLAAGDHQSACSLFDEAVALAPGSLAAWEGLRSAARELADPQRQAQACGTLATLVKSEARAAKLLREHAALLDEIGETEQALTALERSVELDITQRPAFNQLLSKYKSLALHSKLLALTQRRLDVTEDPTELARLCWERSRAYSALDDVDGALSELKTLRRLEPDHAAGLTLEADLRLARGEVDNAATALSTLVDLEGVPKQQRVRAAIAAVDLYETRLQDLHRAVDVLERLRTAGLAPLAVRERAARIAARAERWEEAATLFQELMRERAQSADRAAAARLTMVIFRDQLKQPERAADAASALLEDEPTDAEAIDFVLSGHLPPELTQRLARNSAAELARTLRELPEADNLARLARVAEYLEDRSLRHRALGGLVAIGKHSEGVLDELAQMQPRMHCVPTAMGGENSWETLLHPAARGPISELFRTLTPCLPEIWGPTLKQLGVGRRDRVKDDHTELSKQVRAWFAAFGFNKVDLYLGGPDGDSLFALAPGGRVSVVAGPKLSSGLGPWDSARIAQAAFGLRSGTLAVQQHEPGELEAGIAATCDLAGYPLPGIMSAPSASLRQRLEDETPRAIRRLLPPLAQAIAQGGQTANTWIDGAKASLDRAGAVAISDISWLISNAEERASANRPTDSEARQRVSELLGFVLGEEFASVRGALEGQRQ